MKGIVAVVSILMLTACGGSSDGDSTTPTNPTPPPPTNPAAGTELSRECDGYTLVRELADGNGGSTLEREDESTECGWEEPVLDISVKRASGDHFKPVLIEVSYSQFGDALEWSYEEPTAGNVKRTESGLEITSDGNLGTHQIVIQGEEYQFELVREPVCNVDRQEAPSGGYSLGGVDCEGLRQGASTDDYIYYGPQDDDTQIVTWTIVYVTSRADSAWEVGVEPPRYYSMDEQPFRIATLEVNRMNEILEQSGVYVRLELVAAYTTDSFSRYDKRRWIDAGVFERSDIVMNYTTISGACGFAGMSGKFRSRAEKGWLYYLTANSICGADVALHEIGHAVGLGHGIFNSGQPGCGVTFPDFACGQGTICRYGSDIMFYGGGKKVFSTPLMQCSELYPNQAYRYEEDEVSGRLDFSATAYAINRVRYDVSLIHNEYLNVESSPIIRALDYEYPAPEIFGEIIHD